MSRAINVSATTPEVVALCGKHGAIISAIETLASGGTRVVLTDIIGTEKMRKAFGRKVLTGEVSRTPMRLRGR